MRQRIKVKVVRQVTETWEYVIDATGREIPNAENATAGQFGDTCDALSDIINGMQYEDLDRLVSDTLIDSTVQEESITGWEEIQE